MPNGITFDDEPEKLPRIVFFGRTRLAQSMGCCGMRTCSGWNGFSARMACAGGCGEVYVDEYLNHPPINDPCGSCDTGCDSCGSGSCGANYVGGTCQPSRPVLKRLAQFWGIQYIPSDCGECGSGGCDCGGSGSIVSGYSAHSSGDCNCGGSHSGHSVESAPMEVYEGSLQPVPQTRQNIVPEPVQAAPKKAPPANAVPAEEIQPKQGPSGIDANQSFHTSCLNQQTNTSHDHRANWLQPPPEHIATGSPPVILAGGGSSLPSTA